MLPDNDKQVQVNWVRLRDKDHKVVLRSEWWGSSRSLRWRRDTMWSSRSVRWWRDNISPVTRLPKAQRMR